MTGVDEPGRSGGRADPDGLVRPYVRGSGGDAYRPPMRPDQLDADGWFARGDLDPVGARDAGSQPTRRYGPGMLSALPERGWFMAIGGVALLAVVGSVMVFLSQPQSKLLASVCDAGRCDQGVASSPSGTWPLADAPASAGRSIHPSHMAPTRSTTWPVISYPAPSPTSSGRAAPSAKPSAKPTSTPTRPDPTTSPTPTSTPTPSHTPQSVQVSYAVVAHWAEGFHGRFTIVNKGTTAINGWELAAELPGDAIQRVWAGSFHTDNDTLYIDPSSSQQMIAPGATVTEDFIADGSTTSVTDCTFNGSAC